MSRTKSSFIIAGAALLIFGLAAMIVPTFTTQDTKNVAQIGTLKIQTQEDTPHTVPPLLADAAVLLGAVLLARGLFRRS